MAVLRHYANPNVCSQDTVRSLEALDGRGDDRNLHKQRCVGRPNPAKLPKN